MLKLPLDPPVRPIEARDLAIASGDRKILIEYLEPFAAALGGQPARLVHDLADAIYAYYIADTLAYFTRMLPPPPKRFAGLRIQGGAPEISAPETALLQGNPQKALEQWIGRHKHNGGIMMREARAVLRHLTVAQVLRDHKLRVPKEALGVVRASEELPHQQYLHNLITASGPPNYYWDDQALFKRETLLREAFEATWIAHGVRYSRIAVPDQALRIEMIFNKEGGAVADSMLRMEMPIDVYRKRRLEALAIFEEWIAPPLLAEEMPI